MAKKSSEFTLFALIIIFIVWVFRGLFKTSDDLIKAEIVHSKKSKTRWLIIVLPIIGLFGQILSFYVDKADKNTDLLKYIAPDFLNAKQGLITISREGRLAPEKIGFKELSNIGRELYFEEKKNSLPSNSYIPNFIILSIAYHSGIYVKDNNSFGTGSIQFQIHNFTNFEKPFPVNIDKINNKLEDQKNWTLLKLAGTIFSISFLLQIISVILSFRNSESKVLISKEDLLKVLEISDNKSP